jgi:hypothetical protein
MTKLFEDGKDSIIVAEEFVGLADPLKMTDERWEDVAGFLDIQQDVKFIVTYRDFFDWSVSFYTFTMTYGYKNHCKTFQHPSKPSILERNVSAYVNEGSPHHLWSTLRSKLASYNIGDLSVFNFHGKGDLATRFVCSLPNAEAGCEESKNNHILELARPTDVDFLHADLISMAAWKADLYFNKTAIVHHRIKVDRIIQHHVKFNLAKSFIELPLECLGKEELKSLFELSLEHAKDMLGNDFDFESIKQRFEVKVAQKRFCSVNATAVIEDPEWQNFLKNETILGWD